MKIFHCDHCEQLVFFENTRCVKCERGLAFLPEVMDIVSLEPAGEGLFRSRGQRAAFRLCQNYSEHEVCNWAVAADDNPLCRSCRLTRVIPDLSKPKHKVGWYKLEVAKRRMIYSLIEMELPLTSKCEDETNGLAFEFLADPEPGKGKPVLTGHNQGLITINIAEADDAEREKRRQQMHEPYRTLLGHFRHEIGHHYWNQLIQGRREEQFRALFGDERQDYGEALKSHYKNGPASDWQQQFISAYASAHPWEDWAETWAHYLHMADTVEIAATLRLSLRPKQANQPALRADSQTTDTFDRMLGAWFPLTYLLNELNRGLGLPDGYPFVLSTPVIDKLRFVHRTIRKG